MNKKILLAVTFITTVSASWVKAKTFDDYRAQLGNHPSVTQIREQGANFEHLAESALGLPNPQFIVGVDNIPLSDPAFDRFLPSSKVFGFRQAIPNPAARQTQSSLLKRQSKQHQLMAEYQVQRLEAQFIQQLIELKKVDKLTALLNRQLALYRLMEKDLRGQLEAGKAVYGRFAEVDVERSGIEQQLNTLGFQRESTQEKLAELVSDVPALSPPKVFALEWARDETPLYPNLIAYEAVIVGQEKVYIAEAEYKHDYAIQALYKQRESGDNFAGDDWFSVQASVSIPLWSSTNQTPRLEAANATKRSARSAYEKSLRYWHYKMASGIAEQASTRKNIALFREKKQSIKEMIGALERNYESGRANLDNVLRAQISHISVAAKLVVQESRYQNLVVEFNSHIQHKNNGGGGIYAHP